MIYEVTFILRTDISEEQQQEIITEVKKILSDGKSSILLEQNWGKKTLAYEIEKQKEGLYRFIRFSTENSQVPQELTTFFRNHRDVVLRFLIIRLD
ncbi:MAG: 30S ribosomal protein S6 [Elusimicrobia bacterium]|nr:30S ribosomal protein S6 [Elusimicrobiota bacterium]